MNYLFINRIYQQCSLNSTQQFDHDDLNAGDLFEGRLCHRTVQSRAHCNVVKCRRQDASSPDFFYRRQNDLKNDCEWIFLASRACAEPAKNMNLNVELI